jgi:ribosome maturation factor RimP
MINEKTVWELAMERLNEFDGFIVELSISNSNDIRLTIDSLKGVTVEDCVSVSRNIEHNLDRDQEDFSLEVSSAGLDQPLKHVQQYTKNIGRKVKVTHMDGKRVEGTLTQVNSSHISILTKEKERIEGRKAKRWVETKTDIPFADIKETRVIISFK